jgi:hypothetical protein
MENYRHFSFSNATEIAERERNQTNQGVDGNWLCNTKGRSDCDREKQPIEEHPSDLGNCSSELT